MDTQDAIRQVLQHFSAELLKVFSAAIVDAVAQIGGAGRATLPAGRETNTTRRRPGRPRKNVAEVPAAPKPRPASKPKPTTRSSQAEVSRLGERIVALLGRSTKHLSVSEIRAALKLSAEDAGRFDYALGKVKKSGEVLQHGKRGGARYSIGSGKPAAKRGPGRPRKAPAAEAPPTGEGASAGA